VAILLEEARRMYICRGRGLSSPIIVKPPHLYMYASGIKPALYSRPLDKSLQRDVKAEDVLNQLCWFARHSDYQCVINQYFDYECISRKKYICVNEDIFEAVEYIPSYCLMDIIIHAGYTPVSGERNCPRNHVHTIEWRLFEYTKTVRKRNNFYDCCSHSIDEILETSCN
jgi:hypothetical protein